MKKSVLFNFSKKKHTNTNKKKNSNLGKKAYLNFRVNRDSKILNNFKIKKSTNNLKSVDYSGNSRYIGWLL